MDTNKYKGDLKDFLDMCIECGYRVEVYEVKDFLGDIVRYKVEGDTFDHDDEGNLMKGNISINFDKNGDCLDFDEDGFTYLN